MPVTLCWETVSKTFVLILSLCKKLTVLNFCNMSPTRQYTSLILHVLPKITFSTLVKLKIKVVNLIECVCLLDGSLACLSTLIINVSQIFEPYPTIDPTVSI